MKKDLLYSEDLKHFLKRKIKSLITGIILLTAGPLGLSFMFFDLLEWSSLFERETFLVLIFLIAAPVVGLYFLLKTAIIGRFRIYSDGVSNPTIIGRRKLSSKVIESASILINTDQPWEVKLNLNKDTLPLNIDKVLVGKFMEKDTDLMRDAFHKAGIEISFI